MDPNLDRRPRTRTLSRGRTLVFALIPLLVLEVVLRGALPDPIAAAEHWFEGVWDPLFVRDAELFWRLQPDVSTRRGSGEYRFSVHTDERGLRRPDAASSDEAEVLTRILCVGDSVTFGWRVEAEQAWPQRVEKRLGGREAGVEVINAGVPGYTSLQVRRFLESELFDMEPDVIVMSVGINDASSAVHQDRTRARQISADEAWRELALHRLVRMGLSRLGPIGSEPWTWEPTTQRVPLEDHVANLRAIVESSAERGIPLVFVRPLVLGADALERSMPASTDPDRFGALRRELDSVESSGIMVDLREATRAFPPRSLLAGDNCHWNPAGHELVAAEVTRALMAGGLVHESTGP